ncbi:MAG: helix-turn-helix transcriptional regulator [Defluviicoccus sp.]|nr:helix-turn-helix transcriptional regulator [Defluviicoccus sp.]MDE0386230.1 helix-turn-helix transcriptional regulator [Defluviicoccus sp.]
MTYATEHIARALRNAREARGLSQRALGAKAGIAQGHISKIENGAVDLRLSSLVELARVLELDLVLVPRKAVPAVDAIIGRSDATALEPARASRRSLNALKGLQDLAARAARARPAVVELAQIQRQVRGLRHFAIPADRLDAIRAATAAVQAFHENATGLGALQDALAPLRDLRNALAHAPPAADDVGTARPAYSLDDDDDG